MAERINQHQRLIYYFNKIDGMNSEIKIDKEWFKYITTNQVIIKGWIHYNMIDYLQRRITYREAKEGVRGLHPRAGVWGRQSP